MSEIQQYMDEYVGRAAWARESIFECGCRGTGWFLSAVDTRHECPAHPGHPYPDEYEPEGCEEDLTIPLVEPKVYELVGHEDDIPF